MSNEVINIKEFNPQAIWLSSSFIILGPPGSGKSAFAEDMLRLHRNRYPVCLIVCSEKKPRERYCKLVPPIFVSANFDETRAEEFISRQQKLAEEDSLEKNCIYILDDIEVKSKKTFSSSHFKKLCQRGSRHWGLLTILISQYALDFPPPMRSSATFIVIFRYNSDDDLKKLYKNYGCSSIFGTEKRFKQILEGITKSPHTCLIINQSPLIVRNFENCVSFYEVSEPRDDWVFGCAESWAYNEKHSK